ncbi:MAG: esterase/lipase family protein, partial [Bradymonadaceae bacterium]
RAVREADGRVLLMIHGSSATDRQWTRGGHDHGAALARDLGYVPIYLRYNSGRHVSENGADLTEKFERVVSELPEPIDLTILAHSMGGLVARSARHYGTAAGHRWIESLDNLVFVGTPHHGAPLERYGNYVDYLLELTPYSAPFSRLGKLRSAGITDLLYGNLLDADWEGRGRFERSGDRRHPVPLPDGVNCYAIAGTKRETTDDLGERFHWDGMVPVDSGLGHHDDPAFDLGIPAARQRVAPDNNHLGLLGSLEVYQPLKTWLGP